MATVHVNENGILDVQFEIINLQDNYTSDSVYIINLNIKRSNGIS